MKKKKQRKRLRQWMTAALGMVLLGTGVWAGMREEKLQATPKAEEWQPISDYASTYGKWKDSLTDYIPKENAFSIKYIPGQTKVTAVTPGVAYDVKKQEATNDVPSDWRWGKQVAYVDFTKGETQSVTFANIGYYEGENLGLKVSLTAIDVKDKSNVADYAPALFLDNSYDAFYKKEYFLNFVMNFRFAEEIQIDYQFLDASGNEKRIDGMWNVSSLFVNKNFLLDLGGFTNIYTLPTTGFAEPTGIQYDPSAINDGFLSLRGTLVGNGYTIDERSEASMIFTNMTSFALRARTEIRPTNVPPWQISYSSQSTAKVQFPDPQTTNNRYSEIIDEGKKGLLSSGSEQIVDTIGYQFIQQVPAELRNDSLGVNHRTQTPLWTLNPIGITDTLQPVDGDQWIVESLDQPSLNKTIKDNNWFTYDSTNKNLKVTDGNLITSSESEFYNHYYVFQKDLQVDFNHPIPRTKLAADYTYDFKGSVVLNINDTHPPVPTPTGWNGDRTAKEYHSKINFKAPITYEYYTTDGKKISDYLSDGTKLTTLGEGIVTWVAPLSPKLLSEDTNYNETSTMGSAPDLTAAGLEFDHAEFNGKRVTTDADLQIKETKRLKAGVTEATATAKDYDQNNVVRLVYKDIADNWLPSYKPEPDPTKFGNGGWLDSLNSYIPKENAFVIKYMDGKTKLNEEKSSKNLIPYTPVSDTDNKKGLMAFDYDKGPGVFWFDSIGFYNGKPVNLEATVTVTPKDKKTFAELEEEYQVSKYFGLMTEPTIRDDNDERGLIDQFLTLINTYLFENMTLTLELYDDEGKEVHVGSYTTYDALDHKKILEVDWKKIKNIYSVNRAFKTDEEDTPILLKYQTTPESLIVYSDDLIRKNGQNQFTETFDDLFGSSYKTYDSPLGFITKTYYSVWYLQESIAKVEFPDPQATATDYTEIIDENQDGNAQGVVVNGREKTIENFANQFIQQIPWESKAPKDNRTQTPTWELTGTAPNSNAVTTVDTNWDINSEDDPTLKSEDLFTENSAGDKITVKDKDVVESSDSKLYNHYYSFKKNLAIDYKKEIEPNVLKEQTDEDGKVTKKLGYFDLSGKVKLTVDDSDPRNGMYKDSEPADFHAKMNFLSKVDYIYVDQAEYKKYKTDNPTASETEAINAAKITTGAPAPTGQAIVTWKVPLTPITYTDEDLVAPTAAPGTTGNTAPTISGYEYVDGSATLNGQNNDFQVKVTKLLRDQTAEEKEEGKPVDPKDANNYTKNNEVVLFYRQNAMTLTTSGDIYFKQTEVPLGASKAIIPRATSETEAGGAVTSSTGESTESSTEESTSSTSDAGFSNEKNGTDWSITVSGGLPSAKTGYSVSATLKEPFNNGTQGGSLSDVLVFKKEGGAATNGTTIPLTASTASPVELFREDPANNPVPYTYTKNWNANEGFLLDLSYTKSLGVWFNMTSDSSGKKKPTVYKGEIELSLNYLP